MAEDHKPIKYGAPNADASNVPSAPGNDGIFHCSHDKKLWLFHRQWVPKSDVKATLIILHGTVDHSGVYAELAEALVQKGIAVFASDMRGWGLSDGESMYFNNLDLFVADVKADYDRIHSDPRFQAVKARFILGKSLGGLIAAHVVASHPKIFTGIIGLSGAFEISQSLPPSFIVLLLQLVAALFPKLRLKPIVNKIDIVSDAHALQQWEADPLASKDSGTITYVTTIAAAAQALPAKIPSMDLPMLMMWGTADRVVSRRGHELMIELSKAPDRELKDYPGAKHNILNEPANKAQAVADIAAFISRHAAPPTAV